MSLSVDLQTLQKLMRCQPNERDEGNVYDCAMRGFKRARFNPEAKIHMVFRDADRKGAAEGGPQDRVILSCC